MKFSILFPAITLLQLLPGTTLAAREGTKCCDYYTHACQMNEVGGSHYGCLKLGTDSFCVNQAGDPQCTKACWNEFGKKFGRLPFPYKTPAVNGGPYCVCSRTDAKYGGDVSC
ncbi:hypothetical protein FKW77_007096 [Venturia effusa]|uniref:Uncharacterized protein n=1 Tax=Venturia effusa TaxID=50376 RepID=A0A517LCJ4_9PEZI|nr:hypothetical protein FKW77_007096 [Venturia effusa]